MTIVYLAVNPTEFLCEDAEELFFEEVAIPNPNPRLPRVYIVPLYPSVFNAKRWKDGYLVVGRIWLFGTREAGIGEIEKLKERLK